MPYRRDFSCLTVCTETESSCSYPLPNDTSFSSSKQQDAMPKELTVIPNLNLASIFNPAAKQAFANFLQPILKKNETAEVLNVFTRPCDGFGNVAQVSLTC